MGIGSVVGSLRLSSTFFARSGSFLGKVGKGLFQRLHAKVAVLPGALGAVEEAAISMSLNRASMKLRSTTLAGCGGVQAVMR